MVQVEYRDKKQVKNMNELVKEISKMGIVPVIVLNDAAKAVRTAKALLDGGIDCAEVTFRTEAAEESIRNIAEAYPDMLLGAGTVLSIEQVDRAVAAGAKFIVTPGYNPEVVNYCVKKGVAIVPGCMDTNSIEMALCAGLDTVKFFPAEQAGGVKMLKALAGPYVNLHFMPTGGVNKENLLEYLSFDKVTACGGSWMVKKDLIEKDQFDEITRLSREAVMAMLNFRVVHVGINNDSEEEAEQEVSRLCSLFGFKKDVKSASTFASEGIEVCRKRFPGAHGHIAIGTSSCERAMYFLSKCGVEFDIETAKYKGGRLTSVYLKEQVGGFALHLVEK